MTYIFRSVLFIVAFLFFFFKQKTAYEMRISDWSSDVCSSDLQQQALFLLVERVEHLLANVDAEQRRHRHEDVAGRDQRREMLEEQRRQQGGDVQAVGI